LRKVVQALEERRAAVFGLERENANRQLASAGSMFGLMVLLAAAEFVLVTFVSPFMPQEKILPTPTMNLLATPTVTLPPASASPAAAGTERRCQRSPMAVFQVNWSLRMWFPDRNLAKQSN
jgi:CHASE1-domain containing sensor protein